MANTTNFGWETPDDTDLVKDGAAAMRTLGNAIDASLVDLKGGTSGQILAKNSNTDMDFVWIANDQGDITAVTAGTGISGGGTTGAVTVTNSMATAIDAKGDLIVGTGADTFARLAVGTNGHQLVADSAETTGLKWVAPSVSALTYVGGTSFTNSSSTSVNDVFSSTYQNYRIILNFTSTVTDNIYMRLRVSGADDTTSNYDTQNFIVASTTVAGNRDTGLSFFVFAGMGANPNLSDIVIGSPNETAKTSFIQKSLYSGNSLQMKGGNFTQTTSFTGLTFYPSSGTMTGTIRVYGIGNS